MTMDVDFQRKRQETAARPQSGRVFPENRLRQARNMDLERVI
jgi:hypothetical protein